METMPYRLVRLLEHRIIVNVTDNSGIGTYEYSIGSAPGDRDIMNWKLGQDSVGTFSVEGYQEDVVYYANARATDRVGFVSETVSSDGFKMDYTLIGWNRNHQQ